MKRLQQLVAIGGVLSLFPLLSPSETKAEALPLCGVTQELESREFSFGGNLVEEGHSGVFGAPCGEGFVKGEIGIRPWKDADRCSVEWINPGDPSDCRVRFRGVTKAFWGGIACRAWVSHKRVCRIEDTIVVPGDIDGGGNDDFFQVVDPEGWSQGGSRPALRVFAQFFETAPLIRREIGLESRVRAVLVGEFIDDGQRRVILALQNGAVQSYVVRSGPALEREQPPIGSSISLGGLYSGIWTEPDFQAVSGNFDDDPQQEVAVFHSETGRFEILSGSTNEHGEFTGLGYSNVRLGDLQGVDLRGHHLVVGRFRNNSDRDDLLFFDSKTQRVSRFDSVARSGRNEFEFKFDLSVPEFSGQNEVIAANLRGGETDDLLIRNPGNGAIKFLQAWPDTLASPWVLAAVLDVQPGEFPISAGKSRMWRVRGGQSSSDSRDALLFAKDGRMNLLRPTKDPESGEKTYWSVYSTDKFYSTSDIPTQYKISVVPDRDGDGYIDDDGWFVFDRHSGSRLPPTYKPFDYAPYARWDSAGWRVWDDIQIDCDDSNKDIFPGQTWYLDRDHDGSPGRSNTENGTEFVVDSDCDPSLNRNYSPNKEGYSFESYLGKKLDCDDQDASVQICNTPALRQPYIVVPELPPSRPPGTKACDGVSLEVQEVKESGRTTCAQINCTEVTPEREPGEGFFYARNGTCHFVETTAALGDEVRLCLPLTTPSMGNSMEREMLNYCPSVGGKQCFTILHRKPNGDVTRIGTALSPETSSNGTKLICAELEPEALRLLDDEESSAFSTQASTRSFAAVLDPNQGYFHLAVDTSDVDFDGVFAASDNCPTRYNALQGDLDNDGVGDVCDNCPYDYNSNQRDWDEDGLGDACDADRAPVPAPLTPPLLLGVLLTGLGMLRKTSTRFSIFS